MMKYVLKNGYWCDFGFAADIYEGDKKIGTCEKSFDRDYSRQFLEEGYRHLGNGDEKFLEFDINFQLKMMTLEEMCDNVIHANEEEVLKRTILHKCMDKGYSHVVWFPGKPNDHFMGKWCGYTVDQIKKFVDTNYLPKNGKVGEEYEVHCLFVEGEKSTSSTAPLVSPTPVVPVAPVVPQVTQTKPTQQGVTKMTKVTQFNKFNLPEIREAINKALKTALEPYGIDGKLGKISFQTNTFKADLNVAIVGVEGEGENVKSFEQAQFEANCRMFGFKPEDYRKPFKTHSGTYLLSGFKPNNHKYPILGVQVGTGKGYKFTMAQVANIKQG
jgi:hypothetical protein